jgi:hypothetical protein
MQKFFLRTFKTLFILLLLSNTAHAQEEMDFEEFMGMMSETMTNEQLDELSFQVPWDIKVSSYAYGDFSGDSKDDIVLGIREKGVTPSKTVDVYFFENVDNKTYKLIKKKNYKWFEINLEVAFMVKENQCFVTNRDNSFWYFVSYEIQNQQLVQVSKEEYPLDIEKAGN